jgi:hypothetical protein
MTKRYTRQVAELWQIDFTLITMGFTVAASFAISYLAMIVLDRPRMGNLKFPRVRKTIPAFAYGILVAKLILRGWLYNVSGEVFDVFDWV